MKRLLLPSQPVVGSRRRLRTADGATEGLRRVTVGHAEEALRTGGLAVRQAPKETLESALQLVDRSIHSFEN